MSASRAACSTGARRSPPTAFLVCPSWLRTGVNSCPVSSGLRGHSCSSGQVSPRFHIRRRRPGFSPASPIAARARNVHPRAVDSSCDSAQPSNPPAASSLLPPVFLFAGSAPPHRKIFPAGPRGSGVPRPPPPSTAAPAARASTRSLRYRRPAPQLSGSSPGLFPIPPRPFPTLFSPTGAPRSLAVILDQPLPCRKIFSGQVPGLLEFLACLLRQRQRGKHRSMLGLLPVRSSQPLVIHGIPGLQSHRLFRSRDGRVMLLQFVICFCQQELDFSVLRIFRCRCLQDLRRGSVVAQLISLARPCKRLIRLHGLRRR